MVTEFSLLDFTSNVKSNSFLVLEIPRLAPPLVSNNRGKIRRGDNVGRFNHALD